MINGILQKPHAARIALVGQDAQGRQHARVDLAACYPTLPREAMVVRDIWLTFAGQSAIVVRDRFGALPGGAEIRTHWLGGHPLAWAFVDGWARLSDGQRAVWIGTPQGPIQPADLTRHPGSRGPLTLTHRQTFVGDRGIGWWVFWCDDAGGWTPPSINVDGSTLRLGVPGVPPAAAWSFGD